MLSVSCSFFLSLTSLSLFHFYSDPSYTQQLLCLTFPMIGNYGVPDGTVDSLGLPRYFESSRIHVAGLIVADNSPEYRLVGESSVKAQHQRAERRESREAEAESMKRDRK